MSDLSSREARYDRSHDKVRDADGQELKVTPVFLDADRLVHNGTHQDQGADKRTRLVFAINRRLV